ncbi:hypothetical protein SEUCBS140593_003322 [Sporothrix eucalyptigena]|uniref:Uncharacterized protein n=1 Tax=Sporothrix eucalyptigena TaxID=1812306 RepID=A0ABP0BF67_9PEZI
MVPYDQSSRPSRSSPGSCRRKPSPAPPPPKDDIIHHTLPFARLVVAIQSALLHIRYAISGHMALRLYDPLWDTGLPVGTSSAMRPSIVCPSATRDVLPSWAAVSQNAFHFNPRKPNHLQVLVDGRFVTIAIQWLDDSQFGLPGSFYEVDQIHTVYDLSNDDDHRIYPYKRLNQLDLAPPVLGLKSLLQNIAQAYIQTNIDGNENEQRSLGYQVDACLKILVRQMGPPGQFVLPTEVPAIYESAFTNLYYMSFGTLGMQIMHAISGGMPSQAATDVLFPVPNIRPGSTGSTTSTVSTASTSSMSSAASSSSTHTIHRKPLPPNSRHKVSPMK